MIRILLGPLLTALLLPIAFGQSGTTTRISVSSTGGQGNDNIDVGGLWGASISSDGRYVAFFTEATNMVPGFTHPDVFVRDQQQHTTSPIAVTPLGTQGDGGSHEPEISPNGRFVAFSSTSTNLVPGDTNGYTDIFVHDLDSGQTSRVSVSSSGEQSNGHSSSPSISGDGRFVVFESQATNLVPNDTNGSTDVFVHELQTGLTSRVSVSSSGAEGNSWSECGPRSISDDGRYVVFVSDSNNLVLGQLYWLAKVFLRDRQTGTTTLISADPSGADANGKSYFPSISANGLFIGYTSFASNLVADDKNGTPDAFVKNLQTGQTNRISVSSAGLSANRWVDGLVSLSADGNVACFTTDATNLVPNDTNIDLDVFLHNLHTGETTCGSVASGLDIPKSGYAQEISADGMHIVFQSHSSELVLGDTNGFTDVFVHEIGVHSEFSMVIDKQSLSSESLTKGNVTLTAPAPAGGAAIQFSSTSPGAAHVASNITIPEGQTEGTFTLLTGTVTSNSDVSITASYLSLADTKTVTVTPTKPAPMTYPLKMTGNFNAQGVGSAVDGIICDNLTGMTDPLLDKLKLDVDSHYSVSAMRTDFVDSTGKVFAPDETVGTLVPGSTSVSYVPPLEFNNKAGAKLHPTQLTDLINIATRKVKVRVTVLTSTGELFAGTKDIVLARPPMVLVHGINNEPSQGWSGFHDMVTNGVNPKNYKVPLAMTVAKHFTTTVGNGYRGRGRVENAAHDLQLTISTVLDYLHQGVPIPAGFDSNGYRVWLDFTGYSSPTPLKLAGKRVDVVAHSYGGLVVRWYLADRSSLPFSSSKWYQNLPTDAGAFIDAPPYQGNIRKVVTLGHMWRGVPLCNVLNDASMTSGDVNKLGIAFAPVKLNLKNFKDWIEDLPLPDWLFPEAIKNVAYPTWQVMSVDSPWLQWLIYGRLNPVANSTARPFLDSVAYGSVVGDNSDYTVGLGMYDTVRKYQDPSWFPYHTLESFTAHSIDGGQRNNSDGIVPIWSAGIPGLLGKAHVIVGAHHKNLPTDWDAINYTMSMLNSVDLPLGKDLNKQWSPAIFQVRGRDSQYQYRYDQPWKMSPYPQNRVYLNMKTNANDNSGMGRLQQNAVREKDKFWNNGSDVTSLRGRFYASLKPTSFVVNIYKKVLGVYQQKDRKVFGAPTYQNGYATFYTANLWGSGQFRMSVEWIYNSEPVGSSVYVATKTIDVTVP